MCLIGLFPTCNIDVSFFFFAFTPEPMCQCGLLYPHFIIYGFSFETPCGTHALHEQGTVVSLLVRASLSILGNDIDENH